ncbi:unnamed protein product [Linum tenue]|uniref:Uncharacterized protein n=1 Tax=Linum tenue TaxID=586396 RepID=A0AAV0H6K6_9ROSI|nr:unnamed protein product [Linum tenue]
MAIGLPGNLAKQILPRYPDVPKGYFAVYQLIDVPKGYLAVYVGESQRKGFVVPISYLTHPTFISGSVEYGQRGVWL